MNKNLPKVTVITPTYNAKSLIEACVLSVAGQTYRNIEHLFIDACSADGTVELLGRLALEHSHLRWISEHDDGIYDAMNKGIRMAEGEWIYFLGSDDVLKNSDVLTTIFTSREVESCDLVYGYTEFGDINQTFGGEYSLAKLLFQNICHQAMFFRKEVFEKYGYYDETYRSWSDWEMNIRMFANDHITISYLPIIVSHYATGGYSETHRDEKLLKDLPAIIEKYVSTKHAGAYKELLVQKESIAWHLQQIRNKDDELQKMAEFSQHTIAELQQTIENRNSELTKLNSELATMKSSLVWKLWKKYQKIRRHYPFQSAG